MREIKFRAWLELTKEMLPARVYEDGTATVIAFGGGLCRVEKTLMQYTGLHDKQGKEIYEGDILKTHSDFTINDNGYEIAKVYWHEKYLQWYADSGESDDELIAFDPGEVIGNIYETPELLKETK